MKRLEGKVAIITGAAQGLGEALDIRLGQEGRKRYQEKCGPLMQTDITPGSYQWLNDPWPWDGKGN